MYNIYKIECMVNNKVYIGQTVNFKARIQNHLGVLNNNKHTNPFLQDDFNQFGQNNFSFEIIDTANSLEESLQKETYWINYYGGIDNDTTYNVKGNDKDNKEYAKRKSKTLKCDAFRGHTHSEDSKNKISNSLKDAYKNGVHKSPEKRYGEANSFYGKHHTEETRQQLSNWHKQYRKYSEELIDELILKYNECKDYQKLSNEYNIKLASLKFIINHKEFYLKYGLNKNLNECND